MSKFRLSPPRYSNKRKGFTLIELIIVIVIIAILAAIAIPAMNGYINNAKQSKSTANAKIAFTGAVTAATKFDASSNGFDKVENFDSTTVEPVNFKQQLSTALGSGFPGEVKLVLKPNTTEIKAVVWRNDGVVLDQPSFVSGGSVDVGVYPENVDFNGTLENGFYYNEKGNKAFSVTPNSVRMSDEPVVNGRMPNIPATGTDGKPITSMLDFWRVNNVVQTDVAKELIYPPTIPNTVNLMNYAFTDCINLLEAPVLPSSLTSMQGTFNNCKKITKAPIIPPNVTNMQLAFSGCTVMDGSVIVPSKVTNLVNAFNGCANLDEIILQDTTGKFSTSTASTFSGMLNNRGTNPITIKVPAGHPFLTDSTALVFNNSSGTITVQAY